VRWAVQVAELGLCGVLVRAHVEREGELEELFRFVPVDLGVDVDAPCACVEADGLRDC
jgi:hypothetical protein